ncbi:MAG: malate dehydrogenase, partial [Planctomycetota bacterium]|nr:malate dehydrogenase [Planctomycetota bacterium]
TLEGVAMELDDCAFPLLHGIEMADDPKQGFAGANQVFLVGSKPRGPGMERNDLIKENGPIFVGQGKALDGAASDVFIVTVGNPCNTNAWIAMKNSTDVPDARFTAMTRLDQNRATAQLANKAGVQTTDVANMIVWGNHSSTQFPDFTHARIDGTPAVEVLDKGWLEGEFFTTVQKRGAAIIKARGSSSAASAASAAIDHMHDAWFGTGDRAVSMCVPSDGSYGVPEGMIFSFPCRCKGMGAYEIVSDVDFGTFGNEKIAATRDELQNESSVVADLV